MSSVLVGLQRRLQIAPRAPARRRSVEADREVALPLGVARVLRGQLLGDGEPVLVGLQRRLQIAPRALHVADLSKLTERSRCHSAVARVLRGTLFRCFQDRLIRCRRSGEVTSGDAHIAKTAIGDHQVPLIAGALGRLASPLECLLGGGQVACSLIQAAKEDPRPGVVGVEPGRGP